MNARLTIATITLLAIHGSTAQNVQQDPPEDPVQAAIREFNRRDNTQPNEVTVVLAPPVSGAAVEQAPETSAKEAVLVTGTAPEGTELIKAAGETKSEGESELDVESEESPPSELLMEEDLPKAPRKGLIVQVKKVQTGTGTIDTTKVKLHAPFPAKPLTTPPAGWHLEASESAPPFTREVELSPGKHISLTVRPHILVPDTDGSEVFVISEPGFDPSLGYRQDATVGAILAKSIRQLDDDSRELGAVIDNLQQLLVSLPKPEPEPEPESKPDRKK